MAEAEADQLKRRIASGFSAASTTYDTVVPYFATFARHLVDVADPVAGHRVLDVACGRGAVLRELLRRCSFTERPVGVDLSSGMVDQLRSDGVDADLHVMDVEELGLEDGAFDLVSCGFGVFFFPDPVAALSEVFRVSAPGGRFVASLFTDGSGTYPWHGDVLADLGRPPRRPSTVSRSSGLVRTLEAVGFAEVGVVKQVEERFVFGGVDEFVRWQSSHGGRIVLDSLDDIGRTRYRELCGARLEAHRVLDGYELTISVDILAAMRASG